MTDREARLITEALVIYTMLGTDQAWAAFQSRYEAFELACAAVLAERAADHGGRKIVTDQSQPVQGTQSVTRALMTLLEQREKRGIATYGRSLETFNGQDAPHDLVEELIDAAQYALQWRIERATLRALLREMVARSNPLREGCSCATCTLLQRCREVLS